MYNKSDHQWFNFKVIFQSQLNTLTSCEKKNCITSIPRAKRLKRCILASSMNDRMNKMYDYIGQFESLIVGLWSSVRLTDCCLEVGMIKIDDIMNKMHNCVA